ncbi:MAG: hypothetical protein NVSMB56_03830 [Pyrinomonadaceae bacterium]
MTNENQTYSNHVRHHPPFIFFMVVLIINIIWTIVQFVTNPGWNQAEIVLLACALLVMGGLTRTNALKVQDRVIRLEEQLRYQRVLSPEIATRANELGTGQIIALRFASDAELPALIEQVLDGKFAKSGEIKKTIKNWRGDYLRV